jgi:hypothetical protein
MVKSSKNCITLFFVTLFLLFKVAGLHALSHYGKDIDVQHCEVCDITTTANFTPLLQTESPVLPKTEYYFSEPKFNTNTQFVVFNNRFLSSNLLTRPPPQLS